MNPFGEFDELPCVPCYPAVESRKYRAITRGVLTTSTANGMGFISYSAANPAKEIATITYTSANTWAGTDFTQTAATGITSAARGSLPYSSAQFLTSSNFMQAKLVGSGIRIRNTSPVTSRSGSVLGCRINDNNQLSAIGKANLQTMPETVFAAGDAGAGMGAWQSITWRPCDEADLDFPSVAVNYAVAPATSNSIGFFITGTGVQTFEWEIVEFWEFIGTDGTLIQPGLTKSHADPVGLARVLEGAQVVQTDLETNARVEAASNSIVESMAHSDTVSKTIEDLLGLSGIAMGPVMQMAKALSGFLIA